jgi:hypothetical protein
VARQNLIASGVPEWFANQIVVLFSLLREGVAANVTDTVQTVTGHAPRSCTQFARDFLPFFQPAAQANTAH